MRVHLIVEEMPGGGIFIKARSLFSGKLNGMYLPFSMDQFGELMAEWDEGGLVQDVFPMLNAEQREFIKTGVTQEEWDAKFPLED
jgi:hypothetical protein